ncbi:MAG: M12 family metallo-peptidase [Dokdonella sp.]
MTLLAECVAAGLVGLPMSAAIAATPLFSDAPLVLRSPTFDATYTALVDKPSSHAIQIVQADSRLVDESAESIALNFDFDGRIDLTAVRTHAYRMEDGSLVWQGVIAESSAKRDTTDPREIADDPMNSVTLVRNGDRITGNVRVFGQLYAIRPLHDSRTALVEVNEAAMPPDHPEASYKRLFDAAVARGIEEKSIAPDAVMANTVIRVMVNYTQKVASLVGDINGLINLAVAETNTGYTNSGVTITMQLATKSQVTYTETGNFDTDLARYRGTSDGYMDSIHTLRNSSTADVGVLLVNNTAYCGLASAIGASASTAFVEVYWDCATGYYSFAHEIGHLQSARHDPANDPTNTPYAYGHGYQYSAGGWRTIMAYDCSSGCTRLNFWSNPGKTYNGHAMGTTSKNDNHRVLNNTRATIAAFR